MSYISGIFVAIASILLQGCAPETTGEAALRWKETREASANLGDIQATRDLALFNLFGYIPIQTKHGFIVYEAHSRDHALARALLEQAAKAGDASSATYLGIMCKNGSGGPRDLTKAREWLDHGVKADHIEAFVELGTLLLSEPQTKADLERGRKLLEAVEARSNPIVPRALEALAVMWAEGKGVNRNLAHANAYRRRAANLREENAAQVKSIERAMQDAQQRIAALEPSLREAAKRTQAIQLLFSLGLGLAVAANTSALAPNAPCSVACSPPSVTDLVSYGVIK